LDQIYTEITKLTPTSPLVLTPSLPTTQHGVIHMTVKGQKTGVFKGECTIKGLEGSIVCLNYSHSIISPRDPASGLPTGQRQHKPLIITKYSDSTTPLFYNTLVTNENLTEVILKFYQTNDRNIPVEIMEIKLTNANMAGINAEYPNLETISFTYQKIQWTNIQTGITAMDDWEVPVN
jgi:type VI secretion system secreted protein Hcp